MRHASAGIAICEVSSRFYSSSLVHKSCRLPGNGCADSVPDSSRENRRSVSIARRVCRAGRRATGRRWADRDREARARHSAEIDRVSPTHARRLSNVHERNFKIEGLAFSRNRRFGDVGARASRIDAAPSEDIGQRAMRIVRSVARERPSVSVGSKALAPVGGLGDRLGLSGWEYPPCPKPKARRSCSPTRLRLKARRRLRKAPRSCWWLEIVIVIVQWSFARISCNLQPGSATATQDAEKRRL